VIIGRLAQNIFVTYDGITKLLDSASQGQRLQHPDAGGHHQGKIAYMAPRSSW